MTYPVIGDRIVPMGRRGESSQVGWFGKALRDAMDEAEISVLELARRLGTDPTLIRKWLKSTSVPSVERAPEIADAVGVSRAKLCLPPEGRRYRRWWTGVT